MEWKKRGSFETIDDVVKSNLLSLTPELTIEEALHPKVVNADEIQGIKDAAALIESTINKGSDIVIFGDYDADGVTSCAILNILLTHLGKSPLVRLPKRISEGYGISMDLVKKHSPVGLLITVDNGISAINEIRLAKERGFSVLVLDHHLPGEVLPEADVIVDPHISPEANAFVHYCGAGLALKLAEYMLRDDKNKKAILPKLTAFATIGTIADVVPLVADNRRIIQEGLKEFAKKSSLSVGLQEIIKAAELYNIKETDIAFKLGPMINAPGRMKDDGASIAYNALITEDRKQAQEYSKQLIQINEYRKEAAAQACEKVENIIADECLYGSVPLCVNIKDVPEGIIGIIAGKIASKYKVPTFIFTNAHAEGLLKGSGRSFGGVNLKEVLDAANKYLIHYGGHNSAAGILLAQDNYELFVSEISQAIGDYTFNDSEVTHYDIEITPDDVKSVFDKLKIYAPFGEGNNRPVFRISNIVLSPRTGSHYKIMGSDSSHLKLFANNFSAICFGQANRFLEMGSPHRVDVIGTISENTFQYATELQVEAAAFRKSIDPGKAVSPLRAALQRRGTLKV